MLIAESINGKVRIISFAEDKTEKLADIACLLTGIKDNLKEYDDMSDAESIHVLAIALEYASGVYDDEIKEFVKARDAKKGEGEDDM